MEDARRRIEAGLREDLEEKMVLLAGPRQVGKTTVAKRLLAEEGEGALPELGPP
jgi:predicted AAA+ superfamily ATPase